MRSLNSQTDDHGMGHTIMLTGRKPKLGSPTRTLVRCRRGCSAAPMRRCPDTSASFRKAAVASTAADAAFLGPKFASVGLGDGKPPADLFRPNDLSTTADEEREAFRKS